MVKKSLIKNMNSNSIMSNPLVIIIVIILLLIVILSIFRPATPYLTFGLGFNTHIGDLKGSFQLEAFEDPRKRKLYNIIFPDNFNKNLPIYKLLNNVPISIGFINEYGKEVDKPYYGENINGIDQLDLPALRRENATLFSYTPENGYKTFIYIGKKYVDNQYVQGQPYNQDAYPPALNQTTDIPLLIWNGKNKIKVADVTFKQIYYLPNIYPKPIEEEKNQS